MSYREFFHTLTGFFPHPFQERLADEVVQGRSVILRVPTGAGKTWAAVAPFLYALESGHRLADRLLYALPLCSLATSLFATVREEMSRTCGQVVTTGKDRDYESSARFCSLQIGGQKDDPFFESDVVFTTIDQLLSGYAFLPVSLPDRLGNINAGALLGSLLVFDEIHLLDPSAALGTLIEMLDRLTGLCQFVLMTATMSDDAMQTLASKLGAVVLPVPDEEIRSLPSQSTKRRSWRWSAEALSPETIKAQHHGGRTIVLVNSVKRAQELFLALESLYRCESNSPELILLHARFYPDDRKRIEDRLPAYFGPKATLTDVILVTTQVVEAGMDISADQLHTELAPMNALIQRAGRTARYENRNAGVVTVYEPNGLGPYKDDKDLVEGTREILRRLPSAGNLIDFMGEQHWIEDVHSRTEQEQLAQYSNLFDRRRAVHEAMDYGGRGRLTHLVRDVDSIGVLITERPEDIDFRRRAWPRLLGVPGISLRNLRESFRNVSPGQWVAKGAEEKSDDERPGLSLCWHVLSADELRAQWLVALHPDFASYHPRLGLVLGRAGPAPEVLFTEPPQVQRYQYQFELWIEHAERIVHQAQVMAPSYARAAESLSKRYGISTALIEELVQITCALHDTGKLAVEWQDRAWHWQDDKDARMRAAGCAVPVRQRDPIAHTWFDSESDRAWQRKPEYRFPPHAVQGAFATADAVEVHVSQIAGKEWGQLAAACIYTAIARHHGTHTSECARFRLRADTACYAGRNLLSEKWPALELRACSDPVTSREFSDMLLRFGRDNEASGWPIYVFLVRRLRLADQGAVAKPGLKSDGKAN